MSTVIPPTIGRVVWFHPAKNMLDPGFAAPDPANPVCAALIAYVHSESMVNLTVSDAHGVTHPKTSVPLIQDGVTPPAVGHYCEWMPFQKAMASAAVKPSS